MSFDTSQVERIHPDYWRNSQLSIARFSSGCTINGVSYILDPDTDHLVRFDIWQKEIRDKAKAKRVAAAEKKKCQEGFEALQGDLFDKKSPVF